MDFKISEISLSKPATEVTIIHLLLKIFPKSYFIFCNNDIKKCVIETAKEK